MMLQRNLPSSLILHKKRIPYWYLFFYYATRTDSSIRHCSIHIFAYRNLLWFYAKHPIILRANKGTDIFYTPNICSLLLISLRTIRNTI